MRPNPHKKYRPKLKREKKIVNPTLTYSKHALDQFAIRTARTDDPCLSITLFTGLSKAITYTDVEDVKALGFSIVNHARGSTYRVWTDDKIPDLDLCAIITQSGIVKTVLTKEVHSWARRGLKFRHDAFCKENGGV